MLKLIGTISFLTAIIYLQSYSSSNITTVKAHEGVSHKGKAVYVCEDKHLNFFRYFFKRFFLKQYCFIDRGATATNITSDSSVSTPTALNNRIISGQSPEPNPTIEPSFSPLPKPTAASTKPPTQNSPPGTSTDIGQFWHSPGSHDKLNKHEHGDKPPMWTDDFSRKHFDHNVYFGGDEATPNENALKHQAYKGFSMKVSGVELYIRYHSMSAPTDRMSPLHSYEVYAKDESNNVSFWQGWMFHGYPEHPNQRMPRHGEQPGFDPTHNTNWPGRSQFIIAGSDIHDWDDYKRCEQWYGHGGLWSWDISITICGATTFFIPNEHLGDVYNQSTWKLTGSLGGSRRLEVSHYGPENPLVGGENLPLNKWFCVKKQPNENRSSGDTPTWNISATVSGPKDCQSGWLPQFISDTFPKKGVYFQTGNTYEKDFPTDGVTVPN